MKTRIILSVLLSVFLGFVSNAQKKSNASEGNKVDFQYSPPEWQTAICLPDDPHKSLVDKSGELLYHYRQGGREFWTRIGERVIEDSKWFGQVLYSPRVPIVKTLRTAPGFEVKEECFANTQTRPTKKSEPIIQRIDQGGFLQNWANPSPELEPSLRDIAVHMNGSIEYEIYLASGTTKTIALVLCEGYWSEAGQRIQVLSVEGAPPRTVDAVADIGQNLAGAFWFDAKDINGDHKIRVRVEASPIAKDKNTMLNGLWVFEEDVEKNHDALITGNLNGQALEDIRQANFTGPARDDFILLSIKNKATETQTFHPVIVVNTVMPLIFNVDLQYAVVNQGEVLSTSLRMLDMTQMPDGTQEIQLNPISIPPGQIKKFSVQYTNGYTDKEDMPGISKTIDQVLESRERAIQYWESSSLMPFNCLQVPDPGIQALFESSVRNIWQAREIKKDLPVFQVGPTCYRGLWIVDGAFLLEAAAMLGAGDQARNGVAYELTLQKPDGRIESLTADYWKENGIVLWTCVRHAQLTQDEAWLESIWPNLQLIAQYIKKLRQQTLLNESPLDDGLNPAGTLDGGIGGTHDEYTNTYWNLTGLKAFIQAAHWLGRATEAEEWQAEYDDYLMAFQKSAKKDMYQDSSGNRYLPILLGEAGRKQLPQRAQWAFCHAVYPGQIFAAGDPLVSGNMTMLEATEREGMVYGTGWDANGIWNYFASFYGHAWLWQGNGSKAAQALYAFGNHASPTLVWREEQSLKGEQFKKVGDMPHNWASAEFIRLAIHILALDRGNELHLFEGLPKEWVKPGMVTRLSGVATPFGPLTMELQVSDDGNSANLSIEPLSDSSCTDIIVHIDGWTNTVEKRAIQLQPGHSNEISISIN